MKRALRKKIFLLTNNLESNKKFLLFLKKVEKKANWFVLKGKMSGI